MMSSMRTGSGFFDSPTTSRKQQQRRRESATGPIKEKTTIVFPNVPDMASFQVIIMEVDSRFGPIKSHYYRENQKAGFIYFNEESDCSRAREEFANTELHGVPIRALAPSQFQKDAPPSTPSKDGVSPLKSSFSTSAPNLGGAPPGFTSLASLAGKQGSGMLGLPASPLAERSGSTLTNASFISGVGDGTAGSSVMVLRNLNFSLRNDALLDFLSERDIHPISVNYHFDKNGLFRGVIFVKFKTVEDAADAIEKVNGQDLCGRAVRAGFQRHGPGSSTLTSPARAHAHTADAGVPSGFMFSPGRRAMSLPHGRAAELSEAIRHLAGPAAPPGFGNLSPLRQPPAFPTSGLANEQGEEESASSSCSGSTRDHASDEGSPLISPRAGTSASASKVEPRANPLLAPPRLTPNKSLERASSLLGKAPNTAAKIVIHDGLEFSPVPTRVSQPPKAPMELSGSLLAYGKPSLVAGAEFGVSAY